MNCRSGGKCGGRGKECMLYSRCETGARMDTDLGFIKQNAYGAPEGVCFFLRVLAVSLMKEIRNVHLVTHPTRPACCLNLSVQGVTVTA